MRTHLKKKRSRRVVLAFLLLDCIVSVVLLSVGVEAMPSFGPPDVAETASAEPAPEPASKIERLFQAGDCWTGEAPSDVEMPGHVVLTMHKGDEPVYRGSEWVGKALEQIFEDTDHGIYNVNGFCR